VGGKLVEAAFRAQVVIMECTYYRTGDEKERERAISRRHVHVDDLGEILDSHTFADSDTRLVLFHGSAKYGNNTGVKVKMLKGVEEEWWKGRVGVLNNEAWKGEGESVIWL